MTEHKVSSAISKRLVRAGAALASIVAITGATLWLANGRFMRGSTSLSGPEPVASAVPSQEIAAAVGQSGPVDAAPAMTIVRGEMARILTAYQELPRFIDRSTFDVKARAAALGPNPLATFAFVRDEIANELYPGLLRGAAGTLQAGAGNDLDKSNLLAALLAERNYVVRFAHCRLGPERAKQRVTALFAGQRASRNQESDVNSAMVSALLRAGVSEARSADFVANREHVRSRLHNAVVETARADMAVLRDALGRAGLQPRPDGQEAVVDRAGEYYWLQMERDGSWVDLDTSVDVDHHGAPPCVAVETFADPPPQVFQYLTVSVRNEYIESQHLRSEIVLTRQFKASDLYGRVLLFDNVGSSGSSKGGPVERFLPVLRTNDLGVSGKEYDAVPASRSGSGGLFGGALGGDDEPAAIAAQWIDFTFEAPGRRSSVSRALADFVEPAERATGAIVTSPDPAVVVAALGQGCAIAISAGFIQPAAAIETAYAKLDAQAAGRVFDALSDPEPADVLSADAVRVQDQLLAAYALSFASTAERELRHLDGLVRPHVRLVRDQPMVAIANLALRRSWDRRDFAAELSIDFRHDAVQVIVDSAAQSTEGFWANVLRGLVDGAIEHHVPQVVASADQQSIPGQTQWDTTLAIQMARSQGIEVRAQVGPPAVQLLQRDLADSGGRRLASEVTDGVAIVAPIRPVLFEDQPRLGLWAVNMQSGHLLALLDTGLRGQVTERAALVAAESGMAALVAKCIAENRGGCRVLLEVWMQAAQHLVDFESRVPWSTAIRWPVLINAARNFL